MGGDGAQLRQVTRNRSDLRTRKEFLLVGVHFLAPLAAAAVAIILLFQLHSVGREGGPEAQQQQTEHQV
jgi:hypothetical protein